MNNIEELEKIFNSHILFIYTNPKINDATISPSILKEIYYLIDTMNDYDTITLVINTRGGNLATGYKLMKMVKEKFNRINTIIVERCCSTGTFMALSSDNIYLTKYALVQPSEPQMDLFDEYSTSVSTSLIKNAIINDIKGINPYDISNYISTMKYYKKLCLDLYGEELGNKIFTYMHHSIDSHQTPLTIEELNKFVNTNYIDNDILTIIMEEHNKILEILKSKNDNQKLTLLKTKDNCLVEQKKFVDGKKVFDGYTHFKEEESDSKMKDNPRIKDIISERGKKNHQEYVDASIWDDNYDDEPIWDDNYDDEPIWDDNYDDETVFDEPVIKERKVPKAKVLKRK